MSKRSLMLLSLLSLLLVAASVQAQTDATLLFAELRGTNEVPANASTAVGSAFVTIDANNLVTFEVNIGGLQNATLSHIHGPIPAGQNAGVKVNFALSASAFSNGRTKGTIQVVDTALANDIKANPQNYYVNVHSTAFGGGEIRGQLAPAKEYLVSIAGNVTTGAGDKFVTDVRVFNPSFTNKAVALIEYVASSGGATNATASKTLEIAPRGEAVLDDATGASQLNAVGSTGAIRVTSNVQLAVTSNIYNDQRGATPNRGTFGQFVPAITIANALSRGVIPQLSNKTRDLANPSGFRTNLGFFNPNQGSVTVNLTLRDAAGASLGTATVALGGLAQQQNAITTYFPGVDLSNAANLTVSFDSTLPILGYGAVNDNISGDSILIPAQPDVAP
jgi:CHRD domain-containing protein